MFFMTEYQPNSHAGFYTIWIFFFGINLTTNPLYFFFGDKRNRATVENGWAPLGHSTNLRPLEWPSGYLDFRLFSKKRIHSNERRKVRGFCLFKLVWMVKKLSASSEWLRFQRGKSGENPGKFSGKSRQVPSQEMREVATRGRVFPCPDLGRSPTHDHPWAMQNFSKKSLQGIKEIGQPSRTVGLHSVIPPTQKGGGGGAAPGMTIGFLGFQVIFQKRFLFTT